jgi:hypothetical protein
VTVTDFVIELRHTIALDEETKTFFRTLLLPVIAGLNHLETRMSAVDDAIAALGITADELKKDTERLIALFVAGGELTPEQQAAVDALENKFAAIDAAVEAAAPEA